MNLFKLVGSVYIDTDKANKSLQKTTKNAGVVAGKLGKGLAVAAKVGATAVATAGVAVVGFGKKALDAGKDFDNAMSQVAATSGKSMDDLNAEMVKTEVQGKSFTGSLRDLAQELGSKTAFTATQAAEGLNYMALAGYNAQTSAKMLPTVLNLAAAGAMDLGSASDMVTDAQTALGLSVQETEQLVDKMAKTSSKSNTSVSQLGQAILKIGGNAKMLSGGTTELAQSLGILADNGIKGSEAGTHLRNILLALTPKSNTAAAAMEQLGFNAYDAEGHLRPMADVFQDLSKSLEPYTDEQKKNLISAIFNKTDLSSVNALLDTTKNRWNGLAGEIDSSKGAAQEMADIQLDNLEGDITKLKSAWEGLQITVADKINPAARDFVQLVTGGLDSIREGFKDNGLSGAFEAVGELLAGIIAKITDYMPQITTAATSLLQSVIKSLIEQLPTILPMIVDLAVSVVNLITENLPTILQAVFDAFVQLSTLLAEKIPELVPQIMEFVVQLLQMVAENIDQIVGVATVLVKAIADALVQAMPVLIEAMPELIGALIPALIEASVQLFAVGPELISAIVGGLVASLPLLIEKIPEIIGEIIMAFQDNSDEFIEIGANIIDGIWGGIKNGWDGLVKNVKRLANKLVGGVKETLGIHSPSKVFAEIGKFSAQGISQGWDDEIANVSANMQDSMGGVVGSVSEVATNQTSAGDSGVYSLLEKYLPTLGNSQIVLDTGALVGNTVNKTNEALGNIGKYQARGVLI